MASALSYEFYQSQKGTPGGIATLTPPTDPNPGTVPVTQLPPTAVSPFKGQFADEAALPTTGQMGDYAFNTDKSSFWYWSIAAAPAGWVNQEISESDYNNLSSAEQSVVPFIITP